MDESKEINDRILAYHAVVATTREKLALLDESRKEVRKDLHEAERARDRYLDGLGQPAPLFDHASAKQDFDDDLAAACAEANAAKGRVICGMCDGEGMRDDSGADCPACEGAGWVDGATAVVVETVRGLSHRKPVPVVVEEAPAEKPTHAVYDRADAGAYALGEVSAEHDGAALKLARAAWPKVPRDRLEVRRIPRSSKPAPAEAVAG